MSTVFGPVPSRRLGKSLGIDPIPLKTCNWNCVYCQLGRTRPMTNERLVYIPSRMIIEELQQVISRSQPGDIDWVTFVGSGEPTLHSELGKLICQVKEMSPLPVAVITNGALLYLSEVRQQLYAADAVLPSLDAGNPRLYRKVNRPWSALTFERQIDGLAAFRKEYSGQLWVEVMLVGGLNDSEGDLKEIAIALEKIHPDQIHINIPTRPPAELWVKPPDETGLEMAFHILGENTQIVANREGLIGSDKIADLSEIIIAVITRHPMREDELIKGLPDWSPEQIKGILSNLESGGQAQKVKRYETWFWSAADAFYSS